MQVRIQMAERHSIRTWGPCGENKEIEAGDAHRVMTNEAWSEKHGRSGRGEHCVTCVWMSCDSAGSGRVHFFGERETVLLEATLQKNLRLPQSEYRLQNDERVSLRNIWRSDYLCGLNNYQSATFLQRTGNLILLLINTGYVQGNIFFFITSL